MKFPLTIYNHLLFHKKLYVGTTRDSNKRPNNIKTQGKQICKKENEVWRYCSDKC